MMTYNDPAQDCDSGPTVTTTIDDHCAEFWQAFVKSRPAFGYCFNGKCVPGINACSGPFFPVGPPQVCVAGPDGPDDPRIIPFCSE